MPWLNLLVHFYMKGFQNFMCQILQITCTNITRIFSTNCLCFMDKFNNLTVNILKFFLDKFKFTELSGFRIRNDFCAMTERSFMRVAAEAALIRNCEKCEKYVMMMADNQ
jgi:hypothetical protein